MTNNQPQYQMPQPGVYMPQPGQGGPMPAPMPGGEYGAPQQPQPAYGGLPVHSTSPPQHQQNPFGGSEAVDAAITVGPMILAFPKLFVPETFTGGDEPKAGAKPVVPQYSCELRMLKDDPRFYEVFRQLHDAANATSMSAFKEPIDSPKFRNPAIRDMASKKGDNHPAGIFITAKSSQKPGVVMGDPPVLVVDGREIYGGCIVYANIKPAAYDKDRGRGVKWFLNSIWKVGDGTPLATERDPMAGFQHLVGKVQTNMYQHQPAQPQQYAPQPQQQYAPQHQQYAPQPQQQMPPQMPHNMQPQQQMPGHMPNLPY